jgi:hypothetical protein
MRVAKEDVKLAEALFRRAQKKMIIYNQTRAAENQQATIQGQIQAAQIAEQEKRATKEQEGLMDMKRAEMAANAQNKTAVLQMATQAYLKHMETGQPIPPEILPLIQAVMENVALSSVISSQEKQEEVLAKMQMAAAMQQQQGAGEMMPEGEMPAEEQMMQEQQPQLPQQ